MSSPSLSRRVKSVLMVLALSSVTLYCGEDCYSNDPLGIHPAMEITPSGSIGMLVGGQLTVEVELNAVANPNVTFISDNPSVASVSDQGHVIALEEGFTTIVVRETTEVLEERLVITVVGLSSAAVILDHTLSGSFQVGDTIALSRITHGRPADPDACDFVHLHVAFGEAAILIDGAGPFADPNQPVCGFGRIIALTGVSGLIAGQPHAH